MKILINYFLHEQSLGRVKRLTNYFKTQMDFLCDLGGYTPEDVIIISNIDFKYRKIASIPFESPIVSPELKLCNKYAALEQAMRLSREGIILHDHDVFIIRPLSVDFDQADILTNSFPAKTYFSEQLCFFSYKTYPQVREHLNRIRGGLVPLVKREGVDGDRHRGAFSSERTQRAGTFRDLKVLEAFRVWDEVKNSEESLAHSQGTDLIGRVAGLKANWDHAIHIHL